MSMTIMKMNSSHFLSKRSVSSLYSAKTLFQRRKDLQGNPSFRILTVTHYKSAQTWNTNLVFK